MRTLKMRNRKMMTVIVTVVMLTALGIGVLMGSMTNVNDRNENIISDAVESEMTEAAYIADGISVSTAAIVITNDMCDFMNSDVRYTTNTGTIVFK